ncbi:MAG: hypothetical protein Q9220_006281 [cf. Caloplaca sp. 1 TL-2023]
MPPYVNPSIDPEAFYAKENHDDPHNDHKDDATFEHILRILRYDAKAHNDTFDNWTTMPWKQLNWVRNDLLDNDETEFADILSRCTKIDNLDKLREDLMEFFPRIYSRSTFISFSEYFMPKWDKKDGGPVIRNEIATDTAVHKTSILAEPAVSDLYHRDNFHQLHLTVVYRMRAFHRIVHNRPFNYNSSDTTTSFAIQILRDDTKHYGGSFKANSPCHQVAIDVLRFHLTSTEIRTFSSILSHYGSFDDADDLMKALEDFFREIDKSIWFVVFAKAFMPGWVERQPKAYWAQGAAPYQAAS